MVVVRPGDTVEQLMLDLIACELYVDSAYQITILVDRDNTRIHCLASTFDTDAVSRNGISFLLALLHVDHFDVPCRPLRCKHRNDFLATYC